MESNPQENAILRPPLQMFLHVEVQLQIIQKVPNADSMSILSYDGSRCIISFRCEFFLCSSQSECAKQTYLGIGLTFRLFAIPHCISYTTSANRLTISMLHS